MGPGILAAVKEVFPGVPDFICHFHFLRDAGKDLLEADYDAIRQAPAPARPDRKAALLGSPAQSRPRSAARPGRELLSEMCRATVCPARSWRSFRCSVPTALIQWALEGKTEGEGYGFPFDRPHVQFAKRLRVLGQRLGTDQGHSPARPMGGQQALVQAVLRTQKHLPPMRACNECSRPSTIKIQVFDRLRGAMRIAEAGGAAGLNSGSDPIGHGPD